MKYITKIIIPMYVSGFTHMHGLCCFFGREVNEHSAYLVVSDYRRLWTLATSEVLLVLFLP